MQNDTSNNDRKGDSKFALLNRVQRKPVPGSAPTASHQATVGDVPSTPSTPIPKVGDEDDDVSLRPQLPPRPSFQSYDSVSSDDSSARPSLPPRGRASLDIPPPLPRRPLPPTPVGDQSYLLPGSPGAPGHAKRWSAMPGSTSPLQPPFRPPQRAMGHSPVRASWDGGRRPHTPRPRSSGHPSARNHLGPPADSKGFLKQKRSYDGHRETHYVMPRPFHVTLIRRDPTHGNQWNVGTITNSSKSSPLEVSADGGIAVEITTPGYKRFAGDNGAPVTLESLGITSLTDLRKSMPPGSAPSIAATTPAKPSGPLKFERRVQLTNQFPHHPQHQRHNSHDNPHTSQSSKFPKGIYTFTSPWNGTCTFTTGANGRSLKCKHTIPGPTTNSEDGDGPVSVTIAELRFNLPTFGLGSAGLQKGDQRSGFGSHFPPDPDRLDLSLARERAGGGMRGNSAKLGKLIIEDEGLKMLDLVVAACMGVWWKVYDHVQG